MKQLCLIEPTIDNSNWLIENFSANHFCSDKYRQLLEQKYINILQITAKFNRQKVSYQLNKTEYVHRWLKYKEGFSAELVKILLDEMNIQQQDTILDPFLGSGTTALACKLANINSIGFDILPMSKIATIAKSHIYDYNIDELLQIKEYINNTKCPKTYNNCINTINITKGAYPENTQIELEFYYELIKKSNFSPISKNLIILCIINSLEKLSYTAKDGQYLRWDYRSTKVLESNKKREQKGKAPIKVTLNKGNLPSVLDVLNEELETVIQDILFIQNTTSNNQAKSEFISNSVLYGIQDIPANSINGVITSPPYCNRYDYTRIYALELAFLGITDKTIKNLRQNLLTCTVENKNKTDKLLEFYKNKNRKDDFIYINDILNNNSTFQEILSALKVRKANGDINNNGILNMVEGYFRELALVYFELYRVCKNGAKVAIVNDNVRYAGEVIPVDFLSTEIAETIGFKPIVIYSLKQQKGNSSQQMKKYGRVPLRKSITIWEKI